MTPTDLRRIGEALYGERWKVPLAGDLGVNRKTVQRWLNGHSAIPPEVAGELAALMRARVAALRHLLRAA